MTHGDDQGVILPPRIAPTQLVIVPIWQEATRARVLEFSERVYQQLKTVFAVKLDDREQYKPGYKFTEWEIQGIPVRVEIGPRDVEADQVVLVRRDNREKVTATLERLTEQAQKLLETIQMDLYRRARQMQQENTFRVNDYQEFQKILEQGAFIEAHWCGGGECELKIKEETKATIRNIPFDREVEKGKCIYCGNPSEGRVVFAKAY